MNQFFIIMSPEKPSADSYAISVGQYRREIASPNVKTHRINRLLSR